MTRATMADLTAVVRLYQTANTREEMAEADRRAEALIGPAPSPEAAPRRRKAR